MKKILALKWQIIAILALFGGLMLSRGGAAALMPLLKLAAPLALLLLAFKLLKKKLLGSVGEAFRKQMEAAMAAAQQGAQGSTANSAPVIDLCPKCGSYAKAGHRCS